MNFADPFLGQIHGDLRFLRELGAGATAVVYLAEDQRDGVHYAVKVVRRQHTGNERVLERFRRERAAYEMLRECAHVVPIFHEFEAAGQPAFVMEFIDGPTLADVIDERGCLPIGEALPLFCQVVFATKFAHARKIIHRDIKPSNVFLEKESGRVRLGDFGIARIAGGSKQTQYGRALGSMAYCPPEQLLGQVDKIGPASDVYALGATFFEMTLGRLPVDDSGSDLEFMESVLRGEVPDPRTTDPGYPTGLAEVIRVCLAKEPDQRYGDAGELLRAVEQAQQSETMTLSRSQLADITSPAAFVVDITDPARPASVALGPQGLRFGRDDDNDVVVPDLCVSGHHAALVVDAQGVVLLQDLDSTNGTFLEPSPQPIAQEPLRDGAVFRFGPRGVRRYVFARRSEV